MSTFKYDLTIGMIVKNEIKYLRRCLETLQPLRDAVSCQLIITDTGSTDGTKELAQEFADVYLEFAWCDDFAKARNTGVALAEGRWFIYIDADNEFDESLLEIARFLKIPRVETKYDAASVIIRNYQNIQKTESEDIVRALMMNFSKGRRFFQGAVHESIPVNQNKIFTTNTIMHHWGYIGQEIHRKNQRNLPILRKMIEENPSDLKNRFQLAKELGDHEEKCAFLEESIAYTLNMAKKEDDAKLWLMGLRNHYQRYSLFIKDYDLGERLIKEWTTYLPGSIFEINFLGFSMEVYLQQGEKGQDKLYTLFPRYQTMFRKQRKESDARFKLFDNFEYATEFHYYKMEFSTIHSAIESGHREEATVWIQNTNAYQYTLPNGMHKYLFDVVNVCFLLEEYSTISQVFHFAIKESSPRELQLLLKELEGQHHALSKEKKAIFQEVFSARCTHWYMALMKLRFYGSDLTLCPKEVVKLLKNHPNLSKSPYLAPLLYSYLATGEDVVSYVKHCSLEQLTKIEPRLLSQYPEVEQTLSERLSHLPPVLSLEEKQILGHLAMSVAVKQEGNRSLFWSGVSLVVLAVAERGSVSPSHQEREHSAVLLWQSKEDPTQFSSARCQAVALCPELEGVLSSFSEAPPETLLEIAAKKKQIQQTIEALLAAGQDQSAQQLMTAFETAYPDATQCLRYIPRFTPVQDPVHHLKEALSHSLPLLDTPSSQARKQFLEKQYHSLRDHSQGELP